MILLKNMKVGETIKVFDFKWREKMVEANVTRVDWYTIKADNSKLKSTTFKDFYEPDDEGNYPVFFTTPREAMEDYLKHCKIMEKECKKEYEYWKRLRIRNENALVLEDVENMKKYFAEKEKQDKKEQKNE